MLTRLITMLTLSLLFLGDVALSSIKLAVHLAQPSAGHDARIIAFTVPLQSAWAVWLLACLVSLTPGTLTLSTIALEKGYRVRVHIMAEPSDTAVAERIVARYARRLQIIFGEGAA